MTTPAPKPQIIEIVLMRDNYTCQDCGKQGERGKGRDKLQVHHIVPRYMDGGNSPSNLITLCGACHNARDKQIRERNRMGGIIHESATVKTERRKALITADSSSIHGRTIVRGQKFVGLTDNEPPQMWTVQAISKTLIVLTKENGETVRLVNG